MYKMAIMDDMILRILGDRPDGASSSELADALDVSKDTIVRRMKDLLKSGKVERRGRGRSTRYLVASGSSTERRVDISKEGLELRRRLERPVNQRKPVGYQRGFLGNYIPDKSRYLPAEVTSHLHNVGVGPSNQPAGTYARQILNRLLIDLSWNSSRLEGNTYSLLETERLLEEGRIADDRLGPETQMILNHKEAIEFLVNSAPEIDFDAHTIKSLHALLSQNLLMDPMAGGRLRNAAVGITGSVFYPVDNPQLLEECFDELLKKARMISNPFEQSFFVLVHFPYLQPFMDVNKRVSRLAANIPFIRQNLSPLSFIDVDRDDYIQGMLGVYELNDVSILRDVYVSAYERSAARYVAVRESLGAPDPFRLKWHREWKACVSEILKGPMTRAEALKFIRKSAKDLPDDAQSRFVEVVESELNTLHEGNFARFAVRPSEFRAWQEEWRSPLA